MIGMRSHWKRAGPSPEHLVPSQENRHQERQHGESLEPPGAGRGRTRPPTACGGAQPCPRLGPGSQSVPIHWAYTFFPLLHEPGQLLYPQNHVWSLSWSTPLAGENVPLLRGTSRPSTGLASLCTWVGRAPPPASQSGHSACRRTHSTANLNRAQVHRDSCPRHPRDRILLHLHVPIKSESCSACPQMLTRSPCPSSLHPVTWWSWSSHSWSYRRHYSMLPAPCLLPTCVLQPCGSPPWLTQPGACLPALPLGPHTPCHRCTPCCPWPPLQPSALQTTNHIGNAWGG